MEPDADGLSCRRPHEPFFSTFCLAKDVDRLRLRTLAKEVDRLRFRAVCDSGLWDNQQAIDQQMKEADEFVDQLKAVTGPGPLERKLRGLDPVSDSVSPSPMRSAAVLE
jgi:hypothetical protein